jgi:hypothetical protein
VRPQVSGAKTLTDFIINVRRGANQSFEFEVYEDEAQTILKNLTGQTVTAFFSPPNGAASTFTKACRSVSVTQGLVALDLTPSESRAFLARMDAELELRDAQRQDIVAYGRAYAKGGINTDV